MIGTGWAEMWEEGQQLCAAVLRRSMVLGIHCVRHVVNQLHEGQGELGGSLLMLKPLVGSGGVRLI